jgi:small-conductance mechanosensitive channel
MISEVTGTLGLAILTRMGVAKLLLGPRGALARRGEGAVHSWRLVLVLARLLIDLAPLAAFAAVAYGAITMLRSEDGARVVALVLINAILLSGGILVVARAMFVPHSPSLRFLPIDDETAGYFFVWLRRLVNFAVFGLFLSEAALLLGLPLGAHIFLVKIVGLIVACMILVFIMQNRAAVTDWLQAKSQGDGWYRTPLARVADIWHLAAGLYIATIYAIWAFGGSAGFDFMLRASLLTVIIVGASILSGTALDHLVDRIFDISQEMRERYPQLEARANRYVPALHKMLRWTVLIVAAIALFEVWGMDVLSILASGGGKRFMSAFVTILVIAAIALGIWELVSSMIERYLARLEASGVRSQSTARIRTLLPMLRNVLQIVLLAIVALISISEMGVNIGPLLAGAGMIGVAVGLGSQKLVQDFITGITFLLDDTVAVGDSVKIGEFVGTVDSLTIKTIRIREVNGRLVTIPFSTVGTVVNMSRDYMCATIEIGIAYKSDIDLALNALTEIAESLQNDEEFARLIVTPPDPAFIDRFADSAIIIKLVIKTLPDNQAKVSRAFNLRIKKRFDELDIEIPFPQTTIWFGGKEKLI